MAGHGPLPAVSRVRRNAPTIPTTNLPVGGRRGPVPDFPAWVALSEAGLAWWNWAWRTPQAVAWSAGDEVMIARRASLEDDLWASQRADFDEFFQDVATAEEFPEIRIIVARLGSMVTGRLQIQKEMRELDTRLGLTPKGLADLRWKIIADEAYYPATKAAPRKRTPAKVTQITSRRGRLIDG